MPTEPPPSRWRFPSPDMLPPYDLVAAGADLQPGTLLAAYRSGLFPMPGNDDSAMLWWSPALRGVLPLDGLRVSRSLRQSCGRYEIRVDTSFGEVVAACAAVPRAGGWITADIRAAYIALHELGWAHSIECWDGDQLAGGLYGVAIGGLFAGESMFYRRRDASKVALVALVERLRAAGGSGRLVDVQWVTPHLQSLGAEAVERAEYLRRLAVALRLPSPRWQ